LRPWIPEEWSGIRYRVSWRGLLLTVTATHDEVRLAAEGPEGGSLTVECDGSPIEVRAGEETVVPRRG
ncbi:MAG: glycosyl hydrolase family 65 protein, partial [Leucobacter sp.]